MSDDKANAKTSLLATRIVKGILADLRDRSGIGDSYDGCDSAIQREIRNAWIDIIVAELNKP